MYIRSEAWPFAAPFAAAGAVGAGLCLWAGPGPAPAWAAAGAGAALSLGVAAFFRDPERQPPAGDGLVLAGADGVVAQIVEMDEPELLRTRCTRISTFLSLFDVHVNRAPIAGEVRHLAFHPGRCRAAFRAAASDDNQRNTILIEGGATRCVVHQLTGAVVRRVVHWLRPGQALAAGERIGMMKFGSRLDIYLPKDDIVPVVEVGRRVRAGETVIARAAGGRNEA